MPLAVPINGILANDMTDCVQFQKIWNHGTRFFNYNIFAATKEVKTLQYDEYNSLIYKTLYKGMK